MAKGTLKGKSVPARLRKAALALPEAEEGTSCNKAAFKAGKKNFLFMGGGGDEHTLMVKLGDSLGETKSFAGGGMEASAGKAGWVDVRFGDGDDVPVAMLEGWVEESYRLLVPKNLVALLD